MLANTDYFRLFANCVLGNGARRSTIVDLQRREINFIPDSLYDLLYTHEKASIGNIKAAYLPEEASIIDSYFEFLLNKQYIFLCTAEELDFFPPLDLSFQAPGLIENAIIDVDTESDHDFAAIFQQLEDLGAIALHLRFFEPVTMNDLRSILDLLNESSIEDVEILLAYQREMKEADFTLLAQKYPRLSTLTIHHAPSTPPFSVALPSFSVQWTPKPIDHHSHCGAIGPRSFAIHQSLYLESQSHNTCLNRKISIDRNGAIKNCPSMTSDFGNAKNTTLKAALNAPTFKKHWNIAKDQIQTCKDCEFRHICTDCRAYLEKPEDLYSKPLKCGYDPYTNEWKDWSTNPLKEQAIAYYGLKEMVK